jgi:hypothetical protein
MTNEIIKETWSALKTTTGGTIEHLQVPRFKLPISTPTEQTMIAGKVHWIDTKPENDAKWIADAMQEFQRAPISI